MEMETVYEPTTGWSLLYNTKNSVYHGMYMVFNEDNNLIILANYEDGKKHGMEHTWYANGVLMSLIKYEHGEPVEKLRFGTNGQPIIKNA